VPTTLVSGAKLPLGFTELLISVMDGLANDGVLVKLKKSALNLRF
jgi:hypothetical protein